MKRITTNTVMIKDSEAGDFRSFPAFISGTDTPSGSPGQVWTSTQDGNAEFVYPPVIDVTMVDEEFHARFSAKAKEYRYYINQGEYNPLLVNYAPNIKGLDINKMEEALKLLEGTHNFKGFASAQIDPRKDTVKTILK